MACKEVYGNVKGGWGGGVGRKIVCKQVKSWKILLCSNHDYSIATFCFSTGRQY